MDLVNSRSDLVNRESDLVTRDSDLVNRELDLVNSRSDLVNRESDLVNREADLANCAFVVLIVLCFQLCILAQTAPHKQQPRMWNVIGSNPTQVIFSVKND